MQRTLVLGTVMTTLLLSGGTAAAGMALGSSGAGAEWVKPVAGAWISQGFGCTDAAFEPSDPSCPGRHWHSGVDLAAASGTPVRAALAGYAHVVVSSGGFGLHVVIDHGGGLSTLYGHLSTVDIDASEVVDAGAVIGAVGSTGNSTGPHLHFEVRRDGIAEDPRADVSLP